MAFTTEFVMGAGGAEVEEIPVSMSGIGQGTVYPLTTVDAGDGALVTLTGLMNPGSTSSSGRPYLTVGDKTHTEPHTLLASGGWGLATEVTGLVQIAILSRSLGSTSFSGTVYVARL